MSKLLKYRLILDVNVDPQGTPLDDLKWHLNQVVKNVVKNGTLTGDTEATVEKYNYSITEWVEYLYEI